MFDVQIDAAHNALMVQGHSQDPKVCGAITALLGGLGPMSKRLILMEGLSYLEMEPEDKEDFEAVSFGVICVAKHEARDCITFVDNLNAPKQIA